MEHIDSQRDPYLEFGQILQLSARSHSQANASLPGISIAVQLTAKSICQSFLVPLNNRLIKLSSPKSDNVNIKIAVISIFVGIQ